MKVPNLKQEAKAKKGQGATFDGFRQVEVPESIKRYGSTKNKREIALNDAKNTVVFCSKKKNASEVEAFYRDLIESRKGKLQEVSQE